MTSLDHRDRERSRSRSPEGERERVDIIDLQTTQAVGEARERGRGYIIDLQTTQAVGEARERGRGGLYQTYRPHRQQEPVTQSWKRQAETSLSQSFIL